MLVVLVTGRTLSHLRADFPGADSHFDAIVAENGAIVHFAGESRAVCPPVDPALAAALSERGVRLRVGDVLLACSADDGAIATEEIHRLGLDSQLIYNRSELMILPAGITKGTGLRAALDQIDLSPHNVIGVGDAENDHALLDECEVGIAVGDAVPALQSRADRVMSAPSGEGVRELLDGPIIGGVDAVFSDRWQIRLGVNGSEQVSLPASQLNVLICGDSGSGKSHLAGLFAERLIAQGYSVLIIDPEGDHAGLARMRAVTRFSYSDRLPAASFILEQMSKQQSSAIVDTSGMPTAERDKYLSALSLQVSLQRHAFGLPHWVLVDEAQDAPGCMTPSASIPTQSNWGYCLVSWRPDEIEDSTLDQVDAVIAVAAGERHDASAKIAGVVSRITGHPASAAEELLTSLPHGSALLARNGDRGLVPFAVASRVTEHVRHWHKYATVRLRPDRRFYFRDRHDQPAGCAANLSELQAVLATCSDDVLVHHSAGNELSRWLRRVFQDDVLADELTEIEDSLSARHIEVSVARLRLMSAIRRRYRI